jgi:hypothetical protein
LISISRNCSRARLPESFQGIVGSSNRRRMAANRSGTPSAMMSAYIARSSRPIALNTAGPSAGASLFRFRSLIRIGNASNVLAHLGACANRRATFSNDALNRFNRGRQLNPQGKQSSVGNQTITRVRFSDSSYRASFQYPVGAQEDSNHASSRRDL